MTSHFSTLFAILLLITLDIYRLFIAFCCFKFFTIMEENNLQNIRELTWNLPALETSFRSSCKQRSHAPKEHSHEALKIISKENDKCLVSEYFINGAKLSRTNQQMRRKHVIKYSVLIGYVPRLFSRSSPFGRRAAPAVPAAHR